MRIKITSLLTLLALATTATAEEKVVWDPNCEPVNRAYAATRSTDRYSVVLYQVSPSGDIKPHLEGRFTERAYFERDVSSSTGKWIQHSPPGWAIWDSKGPRFSECKIVGGVDGNSESGGHYTARWHGYPYEADAEIWISGGDKRLAKVVRRYRNGRWRFAFPNVLEVFNFDPASAAPPSEFEPKVVN
ncbi:hypothetical protein J2Z19_004648 [Ensifer adhaerens]|uniref:Uncharacterized protein n=1 Tax=Ensifer adhaerens TaxID=106592 RepID=A0ACC5T1G4_ENSAD|nr:hypothetical protein [Ensifer adhaerens]MBP1874915.1 hypothetical protein [Ensifer adhaerens]